MNITSKIVIATAVSVLFTQAALALSDSNNSSDYSVIALKNCEVVSDKAMTAEQLDAYLSLKQQEQKMQALEVPIQSIEQEIKVYTDEIEKLTKLAIQDTDESLHINKALLKQHDSVAKEFDKFMQLHQQDFDSLGKQGGIIGQKAEKFETAIKASLKTIDYNQIQVLTPNSKGSEHICDKSLRVSVI